MSESATLDFLTDQSLVPNPYPYFDYLREQNPVLQVPPWGCYAVTGYEEAVAVYKNTDAFSNAVALGGPFPPLPFTPGGRRHLRKAGGAPPPAADVRGKWSPWTRPPHQERVPC
jgi:hypothetical protein